MLYKSKCVKMPPIVSKLKGSKLFSVTLNTLRQTLCRFAAPCPFHLRFPSFSDVDEARSYVAATVETSQYELSTV
jgi:hypothetical protein